MFYLHIIEIDKVLKLILFYPGGRRGFEIRANSVSTGMLIQRWQRKFFNYNKFQHKNNYLELG